MGQFLRPLCVLALGTLLGSSAYAAVPLAAKGKYTPNKITAAMNARLAAHYPPLAPLLQEPNAFFETMQARFQEQKLANAKDPYRFDFSELGMPLVHDLQKEIGTRVAQLEAAKPSAERDASLAYMRDLKTEADRHVAAGKVSYRDIVEFSFFATRAMGKMDQKKVPIWQRTILKIDRSLQGYKPLPMNEEHALYKSRAFSVFQKDSSYDNVQKAGVNFERAFHNPDKLESLWVPTNTAIGTEVLMRLMPKSIELVGVTGTPIMADGFLRPAGDFWMHDLRHSSVKMNARNRYLAAHQIDKTKERALDAKSEQWLEEMEKAVGEEQDPELREAIKMLSFNFHHDRGFVVAPSAYLDKKEHLRLPGLLYLTQKVGGEPVAFPKPVRNFRRADAWLKHFWSERVADEKAIWASN